MQLLWCNLFAQVSKHQTYKSAETIKRLKKTNIDSFTGENERMTEKKIERIHKVIYNNEAKEFQQWVKLCLQTMVFEAKKKDKTRTSNIETNMQEP